MPRKLHSAFATVASSALAALLALGLTPVRSNAAETTAQFLAPQTRPFAIDSVWNAPVGAAPAAPSSQALSDALRSQVSTYGQWINSYSYSSPVYTVAASQPLVQVKLDKYNRVLAADFQSVPLPDDAVPARGTDAQLVLVQPSTGQMWEFWKLRKATDGWHAAWGGYTGSLYSDSGAYAGTNFGATASGLNLLGGMPRLAELDAGHIDHALALAVPLTAQGVFVSPAVRTDGKSTSPDAIPMGTRFRLDPKLDLSTLAMPAMTRMLAQAAQKYGIIVRDTTASTVAFEIEDPTPAGINVNQRYFDGKSANQILKSFPWSAIQAVATPTSP